MYRQSALALSLIFVISQGCRQRRHELKEPTQKIEMNTLPNSESSPSDEANIPTLELTEEELEEELENIYVLTGEEESGFGLAKKFLVVPSDRTSAGTTGTSPSFTPFSAMSDTPSRSSVAGGSETSEPSPQSPVSRNPLSPPPRIPAEPNGMKVEEVVVEKTGSLGETEVSYTSRKGVKKTIKVHSAGLDIQKLKELGDAPGLIAINKNATLAEQVKIKTDLEKNGFYVERLNIKEEGALATVKRFFSRILGRFGPDASEKSFFRIQKAEVVVAKRMEKLEKLGYTFPCPWMVQYAKYEGVTKLTGGNITYGQVVMKPLAGFITPSQLAILLDQFKTNPLLPTLPFEVNFQKITEGFKKSEYDRYGSLPDSGDEWLYVVGVNGERQIGKHLKTLTTLPSSSSESLPPWITKIPK